MAWTDQCRLSFKASAEKFIKEGQGVRETLRKLSKEAGIPYKTLERWFYFKEESVPKNEDRQTSIKRRTTVTLKCPKCGHSWDDKKQARSQKCCKS